MNKLNQMIVAAARGNRIPYQTMRAADITGVPFHILCAYLEQETSGGRNIFGHDNTIFAGAGYVTKKKYLAYKKLRDNTRPRKQQGVGPMQLTFWTFQNRADELGGCWRPMYNVQAGAEVLAEARKRLGSWDGAAREWNHNPHFWTDIQKKIDRWAKNLKV